LHGIFDQEYGLGTVVGGIINTSAKASRFISMLAALHEECVTTQTRQVHAGYPATRADKMHRPIPGMESAGGKQFEGFPRAEHRVGLPQI